MLKPDLKFAFYFVMIACIIRMVLFYGGLITPKTGQYVIFMHMLFILLSIFFAIRNSGSMLKPKEARLGHELKASVKAGGLYSVLTTAFVFIYYKAIDVNYFILKQQELISEASKDPGADVEQVKKSVESFFSLMNYCTVTLLGLMLLTFVYGIVMVLMNRFVKSRLGAEVRG